MHVILLLCTIYRANGTNVIVIILTWHQQIIVTVLRYAFYYRLENVAIANALQLEAARRRAVPVPFIFVSHAKFELAQRIRCRLRAFLLLIRYVTL